MRIILAVLWCLLGIAASASAQKSVDWPGVGNDPGCMRYSPLNQINRDNVARLKPAWVYHTGELKGGRARRSSARQSLSTA